MLRAYPLEHSYRSYLFGLALVAADSLDVDHAEAFFSCLLHDVELHYPPLARAQPRHTDDVSNHPSSIIEHASLANPSGPRQRDVSALLRRAADWIEDVGGLEVHDLILHTASTESSDSPSVTIYFHRSTMLSDKTANVRAINALADNQPSVPAHSSRVGTVNLRLEHAGSITCRDFWNPIGRASCSPNRHRLPLPALDD
jgi:hypothetical protein